jgi:hypothetical protein
MLEIVTLTSGSRDNQLSISKASAAKSIREGDLHTVIKCNEPKRIEEIKRNALINSKADFVLFLDDDDALVKGALEICLAVAKATNVGVVFAEQACVKQQGVLNIEGHFIRSKISYKDLCVQPLGVHGLVLINTRKAVTDFESKEPGNSVGYEWAFKAATAITHGAIYVPALGYMWTQYAEQQHRDAKQLASYMLNRLSITNYLKNLLSNKSDTFILNHKII